MPENTIPQKKFYHFLAPKYWSTWLMFILLRNFIRLPYPVISLCGKGIGKILFATMTKRVHIARVNLRLCFPEKNDAEREHLLKDNFYYIAMGIFEMGLAWWASTKRIMSISKINNIDAFLDNLKKGHGVIAITGHFTAVELMTRILRDNLPAGGGFYREQKNQLFEWMSRKRRSKWGLTIVERRDVKALFRALDNNIPIGYLPDQDYGTKNAVFAPFFGVPAATISVLASLLQDRQTPVIMFSIHHCKNKKHRYAVECYNLEKKYPTDDMLADATYINNLLENIIRQYPEQYMWQHRRFKNRPAGEKYPY